MLTASLRFRGPDAERTWANGCVGFGHTMLRTTDEALTERQPCTLDGRVWITADLRIDGRPDLIRQLVGAGRSARITSPDPELVLHAYDVWGETLVDHLIGDFAFAIWDAQRRKLFCVRDHLGVKPFYYAEIGEMFVFSNTVGCIRMCPGVSASLDEEAIADFLLVGCNQNRGTTTFSDIKQLPAGHAMSVSAAGSRQKKFWQIPHPVEVQYQRSTDYVEHFQELLHQAVADRLRTNNAAILMSGGLDSPAVAVHVNETLRTRNSSNGLRALTVTSDMKGPDVDANLASLVATQLGIPLTLLDAGGYKAFKDWFDADMRRPEPQDEPLRALVRDELRWVAAENRVLFTGYDGDTLLMPSRGSHVRNKLKNHRFLSLAHDAFTFLALQRRLPRSRALVALRLKLTHTDDSADYPTWLDPDFESKVAARDRWHATFHVHIPPEYELRAKAYRLWVNPYWNALLTSQDPGVTGINVEWRHPMADIRLIRFCMSLPQVPWCIGKHLIRASMKGRLPSRVLRRPKVPLGFVPMFSSPLEARQLADELATGSGIRRFVLPDIVPRLDTISARGLDWHNIRPYNLANWLRVTAHAQH